MDRNKLEIELSKFCETTSEKGLPILIDGLSEAYLGVHLTSYTVHIRVSDWGGGLTCSDILNHILPVLYESTSEEARQMIFSLDVYNVTDGISCHHIDTFTEFKLAC